MGNYAYRLMYEEVHTIKADDSQKITNWLVH